MGTQLMAEPAASAVPTAPVTATPKLSERAMLVSLHLSMWQGQRLDRKTTDEVLRERNAEADAGRFEKNLVPPKALEAVSRAHSHARAEHYRLTLPWNEGARILSSAAFFEYSQIMNQEESACEEAYDDFCGRYPVLKAQAPARLGSRLYRAEDFPTTAEIRQRFGFRRIVMPVPEGEDFRVDVGDAMAQQIRRSIEREVTERFAEAQRDLWSRLLDTTKHFAKTMQDPKQIFRNTTVTKLVDLARVAPKLTLVPDPQLEQLCGEILAVVDGLEPNELRENKALRRHTAQRAEQALAAIEDAIKGAF